MGYQTTETGSDSVMKSKEQNMMAPTFLRVGQENVRLGDIKLSGCSHFDSVLQFLNPYGATAKATGEMVGKEAMEAYPNHSAAFVFVTDEEAGEYDLPGGWYFREDFWEDDGLFPMNDVILKKGQGFLLSAQDIGMKVTYSGAVDPGVEGEISLPYNSKEQNMMGNCTPVDLVLGDVVLGGCDHFDSVLQFLNPYGATAKATEEMVGKEAMEAYPNHSAAFVFVTEDEAGEYDLPGGWYFREDFWEDDGLFPMNGVKLPAGKAFLLSTQDIGMTIQIPSALKPTAK